MNARASCAGAHGSTRRLGEARGCGCAYHGQQEGEISMERPTVLLADDHGIVADGLRSLLKDHFDLVGTVGDGAALVDAARRLEPDVVVSDIAMPGMSGLEALRTLSTAEVRTRVIMLTMHADAQLAAEAFRL